MSSMRQGLSQGKGPELGWHDASSLGFCNPKKGIASWAGSGGPSGPEGLLGKKGKLRPRKVG